jgi:hypothetical protein
MSSLSGSDVSCSTKLFWRFLQLNLTNGKIKLKAEIQNCSVDLPVQWQALTVVQIPSVFLCLQKLSLFCYSLFTIIYCILYYLLLSIVYIMIWRSALCVRCVLFVLLILSCCHPVSVSTCGSWPHCPAACGLFSRVYTRGSAKLQALFMQTVIKVNIWS